MIILSEQVNREVYRVQVAPVHSLLLVDESGTLVTTAYSVYLLGGDNPTDFQPSLQDAVKHAFAVLHQVCYSRRMSLWRRRQRELGAFVEALTQHPREVIRGEERIGRMTFRESNLRPPGEE